MKMLISARQVSIHWLMSLELIPALDLGFSVFPSSIRSGVFFLKVLKMF